jgi:hypothetical protein
LWSDRQRELQDELFELQNQVKKMTLAIGKITK